VKENAMHNKRTRRLRGITLLETLLALAVGAVVIVAGVSGLNRYTEGVQIQASAGQFERLIQAVDTWSNDNYETIQADAPRIYTAAQTQAALAPYLGGTFPQDAFRNSFRLASRTYVYPVPDLANPGNTINRDAVQVLLVAFNPGPNALTTEDDLRVSLANTTGKGAGFISTANVTCDDGAGGNLPPGNICGAFGSYALLGNVFPPNALNNAIAVGLITKGDSSFYGDQLYRYNYGAPDLNTMRTTLFMDSATDPNEIQSPRRQLTLRAQNPVGGQAAVTVGRQGVGVGGIGEGDIVLDPGNTNRVVITGAGATNPVLRSSTGVLLMGDRTSVNMTGSNGVTTGTLNLGQDDVRAERFMSNVVTTKEVTNLWQRQDAPLRLQRFSRGEVIVGQRGTYTATSVGGPSSTYELSDGRLIAGHVIAQDITCADCGGSLSEILPRWRHMGTYFVGETQGSGTSVPAPACTANRRDSVSRAATTGQNPEAALANSASDGRYKPSILIIPRQIRTADDPLPTDPTFDVPFNALYQARPVLNGAGRIIRWNVIMHRANDGVYTTGFALTYCVFAGGNVDPVNGTIAGMGPGTPASHGAWTAGD
jgi:type II secretory pathway pseudopilin PulG